MYDDWLANGTVVLATLAAVVLCVLIHYEGLVLTQRRIAHQHGQRRTKVLHAILMVLFLHSAEIWLFGCTFWVLLLCAGCGSIAGQHHFLDLVYLSAMTFTTVGVSDMVAAGPLRLLAATEALTGFVLIAWSASFTYLEMERFWRGPDRLDS